MHGMREPREPADPEVLSRRHLHEAVVRWELKWHWRLHFISFIWAFFNILLPVFSKSWKDTILNTPFFSMLYHEFAGLGFFSMLFLAIGLSSSSYQSYQRSKNGLMSNSSHICVISIDDYINAELHPHTKKEEFISIADYIGGFWMATLFWFTIFGGVAHVSY